MLTVSSSTLSSLSLICFGLFKQRNYNQKRHNAEQVDAKAHFPRNDSKVATGKFHDGGADVDKRPASTQPSCTLILVINGLENERLS